MNCEISGEFEISLGTEGKKGKEVLRLPLSETRFTIQLHQP